jgi:type VI protein secretion system component VasK
VPLVLRARFERTFFGLGAFAGLLLMLGGLYLMAEALLDPFGASDVRVLAAGTALSLSSFLLVYLMWPRRKLALARREPPPQAPRQRKRPPFTAYGEAMRTRAAAKQALVVRKNLPGPM